MKHFFLLLLTLGAAPGLCLGGWKESGPLSHVYGLVSPPTCVNDKGEAVKITPGDQEIKDFLNKYKALSLSSRENGTKKPITYLYDELLARTPEPMQNFNLIHECQHHVLGHIDATFSPNLEKKMEQKMRMEILADCAAARKVREDLGYGEKELGVITNYISILMDWAGESKDFIEGRIRMIQECYAGSTPEEYEEPTPSDPGI